jgi:taurine dioxygenase
MQSTVLKKEFAVRIEGVDLKSLDDKELAEVKQLWIENKVAIFPDQELEDDDMTRFAERLGPIFVHVQAELTASDHKEVMYMSSEDRKAPVAGDLAWHSDQSYTTGPVFATVLYGITIPENGGETLFADLAATYESLPDDLRTKVDGMTACYSPIKNGRDRRAPMTPDQIAELSGIIHPLVRKHPYLDRKALYLSPNHLTTIGDMSEEDSEEFLSDLLEYATQHVYVHHWTPGDVIMWDNTQVMHKRNSFPAAEPRFHKRTGFHLPLELRTPVFS